MKKYTQKELKNLVSLGVAENITTLSFEDGKTFRQNHKYTQIGYSSGMYGCNGALLEDIDSGEKFVITARNSTLAQLV